MDINVFLSCFVAMLMVCVLDSVTAQSQQEYIDCYQCNVFSKGKQQVCSLEDEDKADSLIVSNCLACLKTFTFTSIHDRWFNQDSLTHRFRRSMNARSKYCLTEIDADLVRAHGCYDILGPNGFTRQCFCHTNLCNSSTRLHPTIYLSVTILLTRLLWNMLCDRI